jgi:hypothetical protein
MGPLLLKSDENTKVSMHMFYNEGMRTRRFRDDVSHRNNEIQFNTNFLYLQIELERIAADSNE